MENNLPPAPTPEALRDAMRAVEKLHPYITIEMRPSHMFLMVGALQVALRHPEFPKTSARVVRRFIDGFDLACNEATIRRVIQLGFDERYDGQDWPEELPEQLDKQADVLTEGLSKLKAKIEDAIDLLYWWLDPANVNNDLVESTESPEYNTALNVMLNALIWAVGRQDVDPDSNIVIAEIFQGNLDRLEAGRKWVEMKCAEEREKGSEDHA